MVTELNEELPEAGVSGGGHLVVGSIKFVKGRRSAVIETLVEKMADAEIDEARSRRRSRSTTDADPNARSVAASPHTNATSRRAMTPAPARATPNPPSNPIGRWTPPPRQSAAYARA